MESFITYFLKVNGLLILFYVSYYFFLRKETFFQSNRWFLLAGIVSSFVLPVLTFTEIVWIDPEPMVYNNNATFIPIDNVDYSPVSEPFDWNIVILFIYIFISFILLFKLVIELFSFFKILKNGTQSKNENIILVETKENQNPFSFFNYLVFNKVNFTEEELTLILIHEKVHIQQKHSIDVLISKFVCLLLWVNPIIWLYRKAILENLEFIADNETSKITNKTYEYQKTLVKAVVCNNQLSITNQFYQSLIKKRIVMLNTNPSHQKNAWKYSIIIPALIAFVFLFQIKTVAQIKPTLEENHTSQEVNRVEFLIDKNTSDSQIKDETDLLKKEHDVTVKVSKIKRNSQQEITGLRIEYKDKTGNAGNTQVSGKEPIQPIVFYKETNNGISKFGFNNLTSPEKSQTVWVHKNDFSDADTEIIMDGEVISHVELDDINPSSIAMVNITKGSPKNKIIIKSLDSEGNSNETLYFMNEVEITKEEMDNLDAEIIKSVNVNKNGKKNEIKIITRNSTNIPEDADIYINGEKISKKELNDLNTSEIALVNIKKENSKNIIEIQTTKEKKEVQQIPEELEKRLNSDMMEIKVELAKEIAELAKQRAELAKNRAELAKNKQPKIIETADGDQSILFNVNMLKIPGEPTTKIENDKVDVYVNGQKLANAEAFLTMDHSKIYYLEVTDKEKLENNVIKVKRIDVKTK